MNKSALYAISGNIRRLAVEAQLRVGNAFAEYAKGELRKQHIAGRSIYNKRYPEPQADNAPMLDTGLLMDGYEVSVLDGGRRVRVGNSVYYSQFLTADNQHQHLPDTGMPAKWAIKLARIKEVEAKRFWREVKAALRLRGTISKRV